MAGRRMLAKTIIESDAFYGLPLSAQALYLHLNMNADDDGFVNNPKVIQRMIGADAQDLDELISRRFLIPFESGVVVIKHWRIHNYIPKDRHHPTSYTREFAALKIVDNGAYSERHQGEVGILPNAPNTSRIQIVDNLYTEDRQGKDSLGVENKENKENKRINMPEQVRAYLSLIPCWGELTDEYRDRIVDIVTTLEDDIHHPQYDWESWLERICRIKDKDYVLSLLERRARAAKEEE